jgi:hypothetical protein
VKTAAAIVLALLLPGASAAHGLDEYLQAARVSLAHDRITLHVDLTPGVSIAAPVVAMLDRDGNGAISPAEAEAYGKAVLGDLALTLDGRRVLLTLTRVEIPSIDEMRHGLGTIQLRTVGRVEAAAGRRHVYFRNNHHPVPSAYLVNALIPDDGDVEVVAQARDPHQQEVRVEYNVGRQLRAQPLWPALGVMGLFATIVTLSIARGGGLTRRLQRRCLRVYTSAREAM